MEATPGQGEAPLAPLVVTPGLSPQESEDAVKALAKEKDLLEREKWELRRQAKEATDHATALRSQLDLKDNRMKELEAELAMVRPRPPHPLRLVHLLEATSCARRKLHTGEAGHERGFTCESCLSQWSLAGRGGAGRGGGGSGPGGVVWGMLPLLPSGRPQGLSSTCLGPACGDAGGPSTNLEEEKHHKI